MARYYVDGTVRIKSLVNINGTYEADSEDEAYEMAFNEALEDSFMWDAYEYDPDLTVMPDWEVEEDEEY